VTPARYWAAVALFHAVVLWTCWRVVFRWGRSERRRLGAMAWIRELTRDAFVVGIVALTAAFCAPAITNIDGLRGLRIGAIAGRLAGQALFGEGLAMTIALAVAHWRGDRRWRALALGAAAVALVAVSLDAYYIEPRLLYVRGHVVDMAGGSAAHTIRILHVTDIQASMIGKHEERALRAGLAYRPDLIVLTGDHVQNDLGRPTEEQAARDFRSLMERMGFAAPLGVFAVNGDTGPECNAVFVGTSVQCLVDDTAVVSVPDIGRITITGLSTARGRGRDPAWLGRLLSAEPDAQYRIVISHAPDFIDSLPRPVDLVLAGHTHGGQVALPFVGPIRTGTRLPRRFAGDLHDFEGTPLHVSRGVGIERAFTIPVRFLCPPEVCVLDLRLSVERMRGAIGS
jgi:predicted MPP superfamily phosphohydrolase